MCSCKQKPRGRLVATARLNQVSVKSFAEYFTHVYQAVATQTKSVPTATMPAMAVNANTNARSFSSEIRANRLKVGRKIRIIKPKATTVCICMIQLYKQIWYDSTEQLTRKRSLCTQNIIWMHSASYLAMACVPTAASTASTMSVCIQNRSTCSPSKQQSFSISKLLF